MRTPAATARLEIGSEPFGGPSVGADVFGVMRGPGTGSGMDGCPPLGATRLTGQVQCRSSDPRRYCREQGAGSTSQAWKSATASRSRGQPLNLSLIHI